MFNSFFDLDGKFEFLEEWESDEDEPYGVKRCQPTCVDKKDVEKECDKQKEQLAEKKKRSKKRKKLKFSSTNVDIVPIPTNKHNIPQRPLMENGTISKHPASMLFNGQTGSGKSTLLLNLLLNPKMYGPDLKTGEPYFEEIYLMSPTAKTDDMFTTLVEELDIPDEHIFTDMDADTITELLDFLNDRIENEYDGQLDKAPRVLCIHEDCAGNNEYMKSKGFLDSFVANRHRNLSTVVCTQSFTRIPRACRLQASAIFYFAGSQSEREIIAKEFSSPNSTTRSFMEALLDATAEPHSFLFINKQQPFDTRYRKGLGEILHNFGHSQTKMDRLAKNKRLIDGGFKFSDEPNTRLSRGEGAPTRDDSRPKF